ncbi:hypothetical protein CPB86DRAFT_660374, partial [Serendipita vermifera]
ANRRIKGMRETINNKDTDPAAAARLRDAFGPKYNDHINDINAVVDRLERGNLHIQSANPKVADIKEKRPALAKTSSIKNADGSFHRPGPVFIGSRFHDSLKTVEHRAGALIHEATHQQSLTGDHVDTKTNSIIPTGDWPAGIDKNTIKQYGGYARLDTIDVKSAADLSQDYVALRDSSPNMHQNADSYRVFGAL